MHLKLSSRQPVLNLALSSSVNTAFDDKGNCVAAVAAAVGAQATADGEAKFKPLLKLSSSLLVLLLLRVT